MTAWLNVLENLHVSPSEIRGAYSEALKASGRVRTIRHGDDPLTLEIETNRGNPATINLHRFFEDLVRTELSQRAGRFGAQLAATLEAVDVADGELPEPTRDQLVPVIKSARWVSQVPDNALATAAFVGDLVVVYAFDRPHSFNYTRVSDLDALQLTIEEAQPLALDNLRARLPADLTTHGDGKSMLFVAGGNFEASLILLPELWDQAAEQLPGDIIACVLARDVCLMTSTGIAGGVDSLLAARDRILSSMPRAELISTELLIRQQRVWTVHRAPE